MNTNTTPAVVFIAAILLVSTAATTTSAYGQLLSKENPSLVIEGQTLNTTADDLDIDLTIHPNDNFSDPSGQETISTEGATDIDINDIPQEGITVIIQNQTVTVTEHPVTIQGGDLAAEEAANPSTIQEAGNQ
jgi:hypothetical protein